jgi:hypothetical protein
MARQQRCCTQRRASVRRTSLCVLRCAHDSAPSRLRRPDARGEAARVHTPKQRWWRASDGASSSAALAGANGHGDVSTLRARARPATAATLAPAGVTHTCTANPAAALLSRHWKGRCWAHARTREKRRVSGERASERQPAHTLARTRPPLRTPPRRPAVHTTHTRAARHSVRLPGARRGTPPLFVTRQGRLTCRRAGPSARRALYLPGRSSDAADGAPARRCRTSTAATQQQRAARR